MTLSPLAGKPAPASVLVDIPRLLTAYYTGRPDAAVAAQRVAFGTSGHRGTSLELSFNEYHVLAITQAICLYRQEKGIDGPLFIGADTHALSRGHCQCAGSAGSQWCAGDAVQGRRIHAHPGRIPRHSLLQPWPPAGPGRRHRHHPVAQPAAKRWLQVQPAQWWPCRQRRDQMGRGQGQRVAGSEPGRRQAYGPCPGAEGADYPAPRLREQLCGGPGKRHRLRRHPQRQAAPGRRPVGRGRGALLVGHCRALQAGPGSGEHRSGPHLPLHDRGLGRPDPHGLPRRTPCRA